MHWRRQLLLAFCFVPFLMGHPPSQCAPPHPHNPEDPVDIRLTGGPVQSVGGIGQSRTLLVQ